MKKRFLISLLSALSLAPAALAHGGDHSAEGILHFLTNPYHIAPTVGILAVGVYFLMKRKKQSVKNERKNINKN